MASTEAICARLCLLTRAAFKAEMPPPLLRSTVSRMLRLGALEGLVLRSVEDLHEETYERAQVLLSRSAAICAKLERYRLCGYDVLLPEDEDWPENLRKLGDQMPQFLFVRGNRALLSRRKAAVAGSRRVSTETLDIAEGCGREIAKDLSVLVSGGAAGVDTAAQQGALDAGGTLILVPAVPARELLGKKEWQNALETGRLLLLCETWPDEPFSSAKALLRNHTIYALGDAALVVASRNGMGGSWRGATDCLRGGYTPVFAVMGDDDDFAGNSALMEIGAKGFDYKKPLVCQLFGNTEDEHAGKT